MISNLKSKIENLKSLGDSADLLARADRVIR